jgi:predicted RNA-binding protein YlxR (DUF448 family)
LNRLALDEENMIVFDRRQRMPGRGAYACSECLPRLRYDKRFGRAFRNRAAGLAPELDGANDP